MRKKWIWIAPLGFLGFLLFIALGGVIVRELWNWLLPPIFGWSHIGFWQALGLLALCRILFGGFGLHGSGRSHFRRQMRDRWEHMTPEERDRFRQGMYRRCGFGPRASESAQQPPATGA